MNRRALLTRALAALAALPFVKAGQAEAVAPESSSPCFGEFFERDGLCINKSLLDPSYVEWGGVDAALPSFNLHYVTVPQEPPTYSIVFKNGDHTEWPPHAQPIQHVPLDEVGWRLWFDDGFIARFDHPERYNRFGLFQIDGDDIVVFAAAPYHPTSGDGGWGDGGDHWWEFRYL